MQIWEIQPRPPAPIPYCNLQSQAIQPAMQQVTGLSGELEHPVEDVSYLKKAVFCDKPQQDTKARSAQRMVEKRAFASTGMNPLTPVWCVCPPQLMQQVESLLQRTDSMLSRSSGGHSTHAFTPPLPLLQQHQQRNEGFDFERRGTEPDTPTMPGCDDGFEGGCGDSVDGNSAFGLGGGLTSQPFSIAGVGSARFHSRRTTLTLDASKSQNGGRTSAPGEFAHSPCLPMIPGGEIQGSTHVGNRPAAVDCPPWLLPATSCGSGATCEPSSGAGLVRPVSWRGGASCCASATHGTRLRTRYADFSPLEDLVEALAVATPHSSNLPGLPALRLKSTSGGDGHAAHHHGQLGVPRLAVQSPSLTVTPLLPLAAPGSTLLTGCEPVQRA